MIIPPGAPIYQMQKGKWVFIGKFPDPSIHPEQGILFLDPRSSEFEVPDTVIPYLDHD